MDNLEIRERIKRLSDEEYRKFHTGLCPGTINIIGVRIPKLRLLAKEILKENREWKNFLKNDNCIYYEEVMLQGMIIGLSKMTIEETLEYLKKFITKIDNWAVCDTTCAGLKITKKNYETMWDFINIYLKSDKEFELRFAIVMMLDFYINEKYIDKVLSKLNKIQHEGYYVKMAVAWAVSEAFVEFPEKTFEFLRNNNLDKFTHNKALQKINESYRVEENIKQQIKSMKR